MPVNMAGKGDALLLDLPQRGQRKHLKAAGVRQNRAIPIHKFMEAAHLAHHFVAGPQMKVIGVRQLDLTADRLQVQCRHAALDSRLCTDIHEYRCTGKFAAPRFPLCFQYLEHGHVPLLFYIVFLL